MWKKNIGYVEKKHRYAEQKHSFKEWLIYFFRIYCYTDFHEILRQGAPNDRTRKDRSAIRISR